MIVGAEVAKRRFVRKPWQGEKSRGSLSAADIISLFDYGFLHMYGYIEEVMSRYAMNITHSTDATPYASSYFVHAQKQVHEAALQLIARTEACYRDFDY